MKYQLPQIHNDKQGFEAIIDLYTRTENLWFEEIEIQMDRTTWFDADMCAVLGSVLYRLSESLNTVYLVGIPEQVETVFSKNGFLTHFGGQQMTDNWETTIPYCQFDIEDFGEFINFIENNLVQRREFPELTTALLKKFRQGVFEIFGNAVVHSRSILGVFCCGQYFPSKDRLNFTIVDLGVGIKANVEKFTGKSFNPEDAIEWATVESNSTKYGVIPGGLGLSILVEFIDLNGGILRIISSSGYWQRSNGRTIKRCLKHSYPGTVVSLIINT